MNQIELGNEILELDSDLDLSPEYNCCSATFKVKYLVATVQHGNGYCSGAEAGDEDYEDAFKNEKTKKFIVKMYKLNVSINTILDDFGFVKDEYKSMLDHFERHCDSDTGSGYCKGYGTKYKTLKARLVEQDWNVCVAKNYLL